MTVSTITNVATAQGNGATSVFSYNFYLPDASFMRVTFTDVNGSAIVLAPSLYTVTGVGSSTGGTVTYPLSGSPIGSGTFLTMQRIVPLQQLTALKNQASYFPDVVEAALDNLEMQIQQVSAGITQRALVFPVTDVNPQTVLPGALVRANMLLGFDAQGNPVAVSSPQAPPTITTVFSYMTVAQIFSVQARNFSVDVSAALTNAFNAGIGVMPAGGYYCASSLAVSLTAGKLLQISGVGSSQVEIRFPAGQNGLALTFADPASPPSVTGVTITTLNPGGTPFGVGLSITMSPAVATAYRGGPRIYDIVVRGADPTLYGWDTCVYLNGLWYPQVDGLTTKGYSAIGAGLNTYQTTYGMHLVGVMVPQITKFIAYHVNTGLYEDGAANAAEGLQVSDFEMVGVRNGISIGNGVATPVPGGSIGPGHINASFRGIVFNNRVQCEVHGLLLYRTAATTEAWIGVQVSNSDNNNFHDLIFENTSADVTSGNGIFFTGTSQYNRVHDLGADAWNAAGVCVVLSDTASNNMIDAYTIKPGPTGTLWSKVSNIGTGTGNRINDTEFGFQTLTANSATPSVANAISGDFVTANTVDTTITNFTGGYKGQVIRLLINDAHTTLQHNGTTIALRSADTKGFAAGDVLALRNEDGTLWRQIVDTSSSPFLVGASFSGQISSTLATGTAPMVIASTTQVANLNVSQLEGKTWEVPGTIGSTTPNSAAFTTVSASGNFTETGLAKRFIADFANATRANRFMFQDATSGNGTNVGAVPNGVGATNGGQWTAYGLNDPDNANSIQISATSTGTFLNSSKAGTGTQFDLEMQIGGSTKARIDTNGNVILGVKATLATTATNGFTYIETCAGAPTGVPTSVTGMVPMVYDTTNHKFWIYDGGWKGVVLA